MKPLKMKVVGNEILIDVRGDFWRMYEVELPHIGFAKAELNVNSWKQNRPIHFQHARALYIGGRHKRRWGVYKAG